MIKEYWIKRSPKARKEPGELTEEDKSREDHKVGYIYGIADIGIGTRDDQFFSIPSFDARCATDVANRPDPQPSPPTEEQKAQRPEDEFILPLTSSTKDGRKPQNGPNEIALTK